MKRGTDDSLRLMMALKVACDPTYVPPQPDWNRLFGEHLLSRRSVAIEEIYEAILGAYEYAEHKSIEQQVAEARAIHETRNSFLLEMPDASRIRVNVIEARGAWEWVRAELDSGRWGGRQINDKVTHWERKPASAPAPLEERPVYLLFEAAGMWINGGQFIDAFNSFEDAAGWAAISHNIGIEWDLSHAYDTPKQWYGNPGGEAGFNTIYVRIVEITPKKL